MDGLVMGMFGLIFAQNMWLLKKMFDVNERLARVEAKIKVKLK